jgi:hypothetical protein
MYAIETPLGRFEAEDEKSAKAALRKATKKADRESEQRADSQRQATWQAESLAYRVITGQRTRLEWYAVGQQYSPVGWVDAGEQTGLFADTIGGRVEVKLHGTRCVGCWANGSGYAEVILLADGWDEECVETAYAIGVADGQYALAEIPPAFWPIRPAVEESAEVA